MDAVGVDLVPEPEAVGEFTKLFVGRILDFAEDFLRVGDDFGHRVRVARMERQGHHGRHFGEVDDDAAVEGGGSVVGELLVVPGAAVFGEVGLDPVVRLPDGGEAGGLGGHDVDAHAVLDGEARDAGSGELEDAVLDEAALEDGADEGDGHVLRAHAGLGGVLEPHEDGLGLRDVVGALQKLLHELGAAFAHAHGAEGAVAGVAVGAEDHAAAAGHGLAHVLVDDGQVRGNVVAAVLLGSGEAEEVVVLVDGATDGAEAVVAVGEGVGNGEFLQAAGSGGLDDAYEGDVVGGESVKGDVQEAVPVGSFAVGPENAGGQGVLLRLGDVGAGGPGFLFAEEPAVLQNGEFVAECNHELLVDMCGFGRREIRLPEVVCGRKISPCPVPRAGRVPVPGLS